MEPAGYRRGKLTLGRLTDFSCVAPQWSPPVRRGEEGSPGADHHRAAAAMEPAGYRRGEAAVSGISLTSDRPQWSPPVIGGVKLSTSTGPFKPKPPQWSPPVIGGGSSTT